MMLAGLIAGRTIPLMVTLAARARARADGLNCKPMGKQRMMSDLVRHWPGGSFNPVPTSVEPMVRELSEMCIPRGGAGVARADQ
jgi:hypothetical protein